MIPADVESIDVIEWEDNEDAALYKPMVEEARPFLEDFRWRQKVESILGGTAIPGLDVRDADAMTDRTIGIAGLVSSVHPDA